MEIDNFYRAQSENCSLEKSGILMTSESVAIPRGD
jgi:hypothetical protein